MTAQRSEDQRRLFREAMGRFATGVTVITTSLEGQIHGMTANGFMSVSLDPQLVVVSIGTQARMREMLEESGEYAVNVLSDQQRDFSAHFAGRPLVGMAIPFKQAAGVPVIDGALMQVCARIVDVHPAGDHQLFVGEVTHLALRPGSPLIFHGGDYRALEHPAEFTTRWQHLTDWF